MRSNVAMQSNLADHWWILVMRGVLGIVFGVLTVVAPIASILAVVILFGAFALVEGLFNVVGFVRTPPGRRRWGAFIFEGIIGIAAGVVTLLWPGISALALVLVIASWAIITGVAAIVAAVRLREEIKGEWLLALNGILSVALGVLMFVNPRAGAVVLILWVGVYAFITGIMFMALGFRLRRRAHRLTPTMRPQPAS